VGMRMDPPFWAGATLVMVHLDRLAVVSPRATCAVAGAPTCKAGMTFGTSSIGFGPADSAQYAAEAAPILGGPPSGQDRY